MTIREFVLSYLSPIAKMILWYKDNQRYKYRKSEIARLNKLIDTTKPRVFYLGITEQPNLGDMAQHYCIKKWIKGNYSDSELVMFESSVITDIRFTDAFIEGFSRVLKEKDVIVFQSGYCTQDLGGDHTLMHKLICDNFPNAHILMMPQTVYFKDEHNRKECARNHNAAVNMLFLARDNNSYEQAKQMFPDIRVEVYPDIVTTLIGTLTFNHDRDGICLCTRNDGEKFYSYDEIESLKKRFLNEGLSIINKDTQGKASYKTIRENLQKYIEEEIESYSRFNVTITDRYHGTIFSLCAGTPVIILKTTDHKVTTGADWFRGVYDEYVYVAEDLEDAYKIAHNVIEKHLSHKLKPYFKTEYYDKLFSLFN